MHIKTGKFVQLFDLPEQNSQLSEGIFCCLADGTSNCASGIDSRLLAALNGGYETLTSANMLASCKFDDIVLNEQSS